MSPPAIDYERLVADFKDGLLNTLRGHAAGEEYLELWVPDEDPAKSLVQMVEAAQAVGRDAIAVQVHTDTVPDDLLPGLQEMLGGLGRASITRQDGSVLIAVSDLQSSPSEVSPAVMSPDRRDTHRPVRERQAGRHARSDRPIPTKRRRSGAIEDLAPCYQDALRALLAKPAREGACREIDAHELMRVAAEGAVLEVAITLADHRIADARHRDAARPAARAILEALCRLLPGMTVQEASDHAVIRLCHQLRDRSAPAPAPGIVLAGNADPAFEMALVLCRSLRESYRRDLADGRSCAANRFHVGPSAAWLAMSPTAREEEIDRAIRDFDGDCGPGCGTTTLLGLDDDILGFPVRVVIAQNAGIDPAAVPQSMRDMERHLKNRVEPALQVYGAALKDASRLRRLQAEGNGAPWR